MSEEINKLIDKISENHIELDDKRFLEIHESAMKLLKMTDYNIREKALVAPGIAQTFLTSYYAECRKLSKMEEQVIQITETYLEKFGKPGVPKFKTEIEVKEMKEIKDLNKAIDKQKEFVRYMQDTCKIFSGLNFAIKNAADLMKIDIQ